MLESVVGIDKGRTRLFFYYILAPVVEQLNMIAHRLLFINPPLVFLVKNFHESNASIPTVVNGGPGVGK